MKWFTQVYTYKNGRRNAERKRGKCMEKKRRNEKGRTKKEKRGIKKKER